MCALISVQLFADRTDARSMIRYDTVVFLSVCLWRCALWLNDTSYSKKCLNK